MSEIFLKLLEIAQKGGRASLIDTPDEIRQAQKAVNERFEEIQLTHDKLMDYYELNTLDRIIQILKETPLNASLRLNLPQRRNFELCTSTQQDCYAPIIPLPNGVYDVLPVYSGSTFLSRLDYLPISNEQWQKITEAFKTPAANAAEERNKLVSAVSIFDKTTAPSDVGSWLGNYFVHGRGQQDCIQKLETLIPFLWILSTEGYLKFHHLDFNRPFTGIVMYHYAAMVQENNGGYFTVDPWEGRVIITSYENWRQRHFEEFKEQFKPKF